MEKNVLNKIFYQVTVYNFRFFFSVQYHEMNTKKVEKWFLTEKHLKFTF
jgi:hypothetical protein